MEWNFAYVLPQRKGAPTRLVVPTSLQMGWVESPPYFCMTNETAQDVAAQYAESELGTQKDHNFLEYAMGNEHVQALPQHDKDGDFKYILNVYIYMIIWPWQWQPLRSK